MSRNRAASVSVAWAVRERLSPMAAQLRVDPLGGGAHVTVNEVLRLLEQITGKRARINCSPRQLGDAIHTYADTTSALRELGFEPAVTLAHGLQKEVSWLTELLTSSALI